MLGLLNRFTRQPCGRSRNLRVSVACRFIRLRQGFVGVTRPNFPKADPSGSMTARAKPVAELMSVALAKAG